MCLLLIICFARCVYFCVEQPRSSVMKHFQHLRDIADVLGDLGHDVIKYRIQNLWLNLIATTLYQVSYVEVWCATKLDGYMGTCSSKTIHLYGDSVPSPDDTVSQDAWSHHLTSPTIKPGCEALVEGIVPALTSEDPEEAEAKGFDRNGYQVP